MDFFLHAWLSFIRRPTRRENAAALRLDWSRIPLPLPRRRSPIGRTWARSSQPCLNAETRIEGSPTTNFGPNCSMIATISREGGGSLNPDAGDLEVTAGWGHSGKGGAVMPGKGKIIERDYTAKEHEAIAEGAAALGLSADQSSCSATSRWMCT